jgi:hypothetical protein
MGAMFLWKVFRSIIDFHNRPHNKLGANARVNSTLGVGVRQANKTSTMPYVEGVTVKLAAITFAINFVILRGKGIQFFLDF